MFAEDGLIVAVLKDFVKLKLYHSLCVKNVDVCCEAYVLMDCQRSQRTFKPARQAPLLTSLSESFLCHSLFPAVCCQQLRMLKIPRCSQHLPHSERSQVAFLFHRLLQKRWQSILRSFVQKTVKCIFGDGIREIVCAPQCMTALVINPVCYVFKIFALYVGPHSHTIFLRIQRLFPVFWLPHFVNLSD